MRPIKPHTAIKCALLRLLPLAVVSLCLAVAAACGDDDAASSTPTFSVGASIGVSATAVPSGSAETSRTPEIRTPTPTLGPSPIECTTAPSDAGLISQVEFGGDDTIYVPGEAADITLVLANCGDNDAILHYPTSQRYNFIVTDENSVEVWRSSEGKAFDQVVGSDELAPYEKLTYSDTWDQKDRSGNQAPDGMYKVSAFSVGCSIAPRADCQFGPIAFVLIQAPTPTPAGNT